MIKAARSADSRSLLREAETAELIIPNATWKIYFKTLIEKMVSARKDPAKNQTGAKDLKKILLAYLTQQGEIQTSNIWIRSFQPSDIYDFKVAAAERVKQVGGVGVLEIHLADRETNSPHIQYVGTKCTEVENALSELAVEWCYEPNVESAASRNEKPAFQTTDAKYLRKESLQERIEDRERANKEQAVINQYRSEIKEFTNKIQEAHDKFLEIITAAKKEHVQRIERYQSLSKRSQKDTKYETRRESINEMVKAWKEKRSSQTVRKR